MSATNIDLGATAISREDAWDGRRGDSLQRLNAGSVVVTDRMDFFLLINLLHFLIQHTDLRTTIADVGVTMIGTVKPILLSIRRLTPPAAPAAPQ
jgi:hypothetical protein